MKPRPGAESMNMPGNLRDFNLATEKTLRTRLKGQGSTKAYNSLDMEFQFYFDNFKLKPDFLNCYCFPKFKKIKISD